MILSALFIRIQIERKRNRPSTIRTEISLIAFPFPIAEVAGVVVVVVVIAIISLIK